MSVERSLSRQNAIRSFRIRRSKQSAPASFYWWPITAAKIRKAAQKIVAEVDPEKIILFGSFAYGDPTLDSDVDLLIIMKTALRPCDRVRQISALLDPRPFPVDIIVRTPAELAEQLRIKDCFFREVMAKGKVVYERSSRR